MQSILEGINKKNNCTQIEGKKIFLRKMGGKNSSNKKNQNDLEKKKKSKDAEKNEENEIKNDYFPLSKLPEPALALVMHHLPLNGILFFIFTIFLRSILY